MEGESVKLHRLGYIGSKFPLLNWITESIKTVTGWTTLADRRIADVFAGTGIVSYHFRTLGAAVVSNDAELYSFVITHSMVSSVYTPRCHEILTLLNNDPTSIVGYITTHYSPYNGNERMFFTVENAMRIDFIRQRLEDLRPTLTTDDYMFLLASLVVSADSVSNVPAVYGCYLKSFKPSSTKQMQFTPIHTMTRPPVPGSVTTHQDALSLGTLDVDLVYLDPPYNQRQYSKNYFPLNLITKTPQALLTEPPLKGKTGIPTDCFLSAFCRRGGAADNAFDTMFRSITAPWIVMSYSSEGLLSKDQLLELMQAHGTVTVIERPYKRFKSFEYNESKPVIEYLFCLHKT